MEYYTSNQMDYSFYTTQLQQPQPQFQKTYPSQVLNLAFIQHSLSMPSLTTSHILEMASQAIATIQNKNQIHSNVALYNQTCTVIDYNQYRFVFNSRMDTVLNIVYAEAQVQKPQKVQQRSASPPFPQSQQLIDTTSVDKESLDREEISDYDDIIDQIVDCVHLDVDNDPEMKHFDNLPPLPPAPSHGSLQADTSNYSFYSNSSSDSNSLMEVRVSDALWTELCHRFYNQPSFPKSKSELVQRMGRAMMGKCHQYPMGETEFCAFLDDLGFVYVSDMKDVTALVAMFTLNQFQNYKQCLIQILNLNLNQNAANLRKAHSSKSAMTPNSDCSNSNQIKKTQNKNKNQGFHTIYMKPIVERMRTLVYAMDPNSKLIIDNEYIINIVAQALKQGAKRQISKRTFMFCFKGYTVIMSKSLKTILDGTWSNEKEVITVHPDVVSIIWKKVRCLDYFTIRQLAKDAKKSASYSTKKNDYRQQFVYKHRGCRIVFASNHSTIVEMQCHDVKELKLI